jgi:PBSX family phage terminase large subunit
MPYIEHEYTPHPKQLEVHRSEARFIVLNTGRRFGKSILAYNHVLKKALQKPGRYWIVSPTYRQAKDIYWREIVENYTPKELIKRKNDTELLIELKAPNGETSTIELKGADNYDRLRGARIDGLVLDEAAFMKPFVWQEILEPILAESGGWAIFISTPKGFNWFYDLAEHAKRTKGWQYFHFTCYDNPYFPKHELDRLKDETPADTWAQEYEAQFTKNAGLVFNEFDTALHVVNKAFIEKHRSKWVKYRSIDFGQTNPTAVLWIGVDEEGNVYVFDELYRTGLRTSELAHLIYAKSVDYYTRTIGDSAAAQSINDLAEHGIFVEPATKAQGASGENYVTAGIAKVKEFLKVNPNTGKPKLYVAEHCQNLIDEFLSYEWEVLKKENEGDKNAPEKPKKVNDHALDALRMFIYEYTKPMKYKQQEYTPANSITGY